MRRWLRDGTSPISALASAIWLSKPTATVLKRSPAAVSRVQKRAEGFVKRYDATGSGEVSKSDFEAKEMQRFDRLLGGSDAITEQQFDSAGQRMHRRHGAPADNGG